jgi:3',5'-cyclic AMP phosphodiesterase CpdA
MTTIVQLSDPHFGTEVRPVAEAALRAVHTLQPDVVIVSGDITQRARRSQFRAASDFLDALSPAAILVIPGNHDIPLFNVFARLFTPYAAFKNAFGARESVWITPDIAIIGFDSTSRLRHTRGRLKQNDVAQKIMHVRRQLAPGAILVACAHQPLQTAWPEDAGEVLLDVERTALAFSELQVDLVLSGHVHVPLITTTRDAFPRLARHFILSGAGTAVSHRVRAGAPNSFNLIATDTWNGVRSIAITKYCFDDAGRQFVADLPAHFDCGASGWAER